MQQITSILNYANQSQTLILTDGTSLVLNLSFSPQQAGWFITSLTYGAFELNGVRITNSPNMLHQFRNQLPFGIACFSTDDREPQFQQDFSSGASILYLLTKAEVNQYEEFVSGG